jgi:hypothetical protein
MGKPRFRPKRQTSVQKEAAGGDRRPQMFRWVAAAIRGKASKLGIANQLPNITHDRPHPRAWPAQGMSISMAPSWSIRSRQAAAIAARTSTLSYSRCRAEAKTSSSVSRAPKKALYPGSISLLRAVQTRSRRQGAPGDGIPQKSGNRGRAERYRRKGGRSIRDGTEKNRGA